MTKEADPDAVERDNRTMTKLLIEIASSESRHAPGCRTRSGCNPGDCDCDLAKWAPPYSEMGL